MRDIVLVAAVAENGVIGNGLDLPWHLPGDFQHFKEATLGKPVVMGRRTFESMGSPLAGRPNIVVTRDKNFRAEGIRTAPDLATALKMADAEAERIGANEIAVIGGSGIYAEALPLAARLDLTEVHASPEGDVHFPEYDRSQWREASRSGPHQDAGDEHAYSFVMLERR